MSEIEARIREVVKELLEAGKLKYFVGYTRGTDPFRARPMFIDDPVDVDKLFWGPTCVNNLVLFIVQDVKKKLPIGQEPDPRPIGLITKGCDNRAITVLMQENIIPRERMYIIGVPCSGMLDPKRLEAPAKERGIENESIYGAEVVEEGQEIMLVNDSKGIKERFLKSALLLDKCKECDHHNPKEYDVLIGRPVEDKPDDRYLGIHELEKMDLKERWDYWGEGFERCIRCYACRNICPVCYCEECSVDRAKPMPWISKSMDKSNNTFYHLNRAMHLAGRCIDCGECERACPVDIPMRKMYKMLEKDVKELYGYEAGANTDDIPLFSTFDVEDEDFVT